MTGNAFDELARRAATSRRALLSTGIRSIGMLSVPIALAGCGGGEDGGEERDSGGSGFVAACTEYPPFSSVRGVEGCRCAERYLRDTVGYDDDRLDGAAANISSSSVSGLWADIEAAFRACM